MQDELKAQNKKVFKSMVVHKAWALGFMFKKNKEMILLVEELEATNLALKDYNHCVGQEKTSCVLGPRRGIEI